MRGVAAVCGVLVLACLLACGGGAGGGGATTPPPINNPMSVTEYRVTLPKQAVTLTLNCSLSQARTFEGKEHLQVYAADPNPDYDGVNAFVDKDTPVGKQVFESLRDGKRHLLTLTLRVNDSNRPIIEGIKVP